MSAVYNSYNNCPTFTIDDFTKMVTDIHKYVNDNIVYNKYDTLSIYSKIIDVYLRERCIIFEKNKPIAIHYNDTLIGMDSIDYIINNGIMVNICYTNEFNEERTKKLLKKINCSYACVINKTALINTLNITDPLYSSSNPTNWIVRVIKV